MTENAIRRLADRNGYRLCKSRRHISLDNHGEYMLLDTETNCVVLGSRYDASLEDVRAWLTE